MNTKGAMAIASVTFGLSACTTLGTNVSGKFRCEAADGICAPSLVIDDSAIARIEETTSADLLNPAGPFRMDDGISAPVRGQSLGSEALVARSSPSYELSVVAVLVRPRPLARQRPPPRPACPGSSRATERL